MLKETITKDYMTAFRAKETITKQLLGTVKGEIQTLEKNKNIESLEDADVLVILNKFAKNLKQTIELSNDEASKKELVIIESYLPKQMSVGEIELLVEKLVSEGTTNLGQIMKAFSTLSCDKKVVSEVIKNKLK